MMKAKSILAVIILLVLLCTHVYGLSQDQEESVVELAHRMESVKKGSVAENRILRNIAVALNDRTALEAFLTDPSSAAYKAGLISLAQAVKIYAWIGRDDQVLMQALQSVANRLRSLLLEEP
ncbi:hypothetical protein GGI25_000091 [Coemansia spiralis]|uniref:Uncharacterized protein n=2 Tax=Coemansia TaxID=4863 RepID=A0A9W8GDF0_9FUNG|nr:hypothetical protein BX070DRAFT_231965 [Coemansia spiralis]KAJ1992590.1 hypothetical protein EDC05_002736 [Coemansia umbellata]KAJ2623030.1 hypothetical protein GGI26_002639 [Coemansia sp. RSA 1358]KAJ2681136.1 hypothetical protein GGI25_000091 [Coemansia spiralis]